MKSIPSFISNLSLEASDLREREGDTIASACATNSQASTTTEID